MQMLCQKKKEKKLAEGLDKCRSVWYNGSMINNLSNGVSTMRVESHENLESVVLWFSGCCLEPMSGEQLDHEICPCCGEWNEPVFEEWTVEKN